MARTRKIKQPALPSPSPSDDEDTAPTLPPPSALSKPISSSEEKEEDEGSSSESEGSPVVAAAPPPKKSSPTSTKKVTSQHCDTAAQHCDTTAVAPEPQKKRKDLDTPIDDPNGNPSKKLFERVWSNYDVSVLMEGLLEFRHVHGHVPAGAPELQDLLDMVEQRLQSQFTTNQLGTKIRMLKKKYTANLTKEKDVFSNDHDKEVYLHSQKIWGNLKAVKGEVSDDAGEEDGKGGNNMAHKLRSATSSHIKKKNIGVVAAANARKDRVAANGKDSKRLKWGMKLIMRGFKDEISSNQDLLERGLGLLDPEVLSAFVQMWKDLNHEEFCVLNKRIELKSQVVGAVKEALTNVSF